MNLIQDMKLNINMNYELDNLTWKMAQHNIIHKYVATIFFYSKVLTSTGAIIFLTGLRVKLWVC